MPDRVIEPALAERIVRLLKKAVQVPEVPLAVTAHGRFQLGGVPPTSDQVRVVLWPHRHPTQGALTGAEPLV
jgi:hypothetical protein